MTTRLKTHCHNPLDEVDINSDHARSMLAAISDGCVIDEGGQSRHWVETAKLMLEGLIAQVKSTEPPENQSLPFIFDLLQGINGDGFADPDKFDETLINMRVNPVAGGIAQQAASLLDSVGERERGSILSTLHRSLKWVSDPAMRRVLSRSDFRFSDLGTKAGQGGTVYFALPTRNAGEYARWGRVEANLALRAMESLPEPPKKKVLVILDEYPVMARGGALKAVDEGIVTLRYAGVKLWVVCQNINQLVSAHAKNWETFVSASSVQVFGVHDHNTAQWVSKMLGERLHLRREGKWWKPRFLKRIVHQAAQPLYTPAEVMKELGKTSPQQVVFPNNGSPMRLQRLAFKRLKVEGQRFRGLGLGRWFRKSMVKFKRTKKDVPTEVPERPLPVAAQSVAMKGA